MQKKKRYVQDGKSFRLGRKKCNFMTKIMNLLVLNIKNKYNLFCHVPVFL